MTTGRTIVKPEPPEGDLGPDRLQLPAVYSKPYRAAGHPDRTELRSADDAVLVAEAAGHLTPHDPFHTFECNIMSLWCQPPS